MTCTEPGKRKNKSLLVHWTRSGTSLPSMLYLNFYAKLRIIRRWWHAFDAYREEGLEQHNSDLYNYSADFKQMVVKEYLAGGISQQSLAKRHTFATRCIEAGMRPKTLQMILGHSNIGITMNLYVHVTDIEKVKEVENVEQKLKLV